MIDEGRELHVDAGQGHNRSHRNDARAVESRVDHRSTGPSSRRAVCHLASIPQPPVAQAWLVAMTERRVARNPGGGESAMPSRPIHEKLPFKERIFG